MSSVRAVVVAAGAGKRFGGPKLDALLGGRPVLERTLEAFENHPEIGSIVLVLADEKRGGPYEAKYRKISRVVRGGERRQDSVRQGVAALAPDESGVVLIHDGARPLVGRALISRVIAAARAHGAAVPVVPLNDTVKEVREGRIVRTVERSLLFGAQTPQGFLYLHLKEMLERGERSLFSGTDEATLAERQGMSVEAVEGDPGNIKITTSQDLRVAEALLDA